MEIAIAIYIFMLGAALGSFVLVVAERWHLKKSWVKGRSKCDSCKKTLQPLDLVPLISWVAFRGKCRQCGEKVSARYPLTELASATALVAVFLLFPYGFTNADGLIVSTVMLFILWLLIHTLSLILVLIDIKSMIMPYKFIFPLIGVSVLFRLGVFSIDALYHPSFISLVIGVLLGGGLFATLWLVSRGKWIGDSDILLGIAISFIVGGVVEVWIAFVAASVSGLLFGLGASVRRHKTIKNMKIPFGPFLVFGMLVSFLFSSSLIDLYLRLFIIY